MPKRIVSPEQMERARVRAREWYAANKDRALANVNKWQADNTDKVAEYKQRHVEANRQHINDRSRQYSKANPEKRKAAVKAWVEANPDRVAAMQARTRAKNAVKRAASFREYRKKNPEIVRASTQRWREENKERCIVHSANRRARKASGSLSPDITARLMEAQRGKCACCRTDLKTSGHHLDHIMPLALGGSNTDNNAQLLCPPCNLSKHAKHPVDFMQQRGYLL